MKLIHTHLSQPSSLTAFEREMVYNGLDCCVTHEILTALLPQLDNYTAATYSFSRDLQGPVLEMRLRGVLVDLERRAKVLHLVNETLERLYWHLDRIVYQGLGVTDFNWRSNTDKAHLFYEVLRIPPVQRNGRPSVDIGSLEKIETGYEIARPLARLLLAIGELLKKRDVLETEVDSDARIRTSYNIAGTSTGRFSSSFNEFGTGGNLQNIEEGLRSIFIAPKGMKMAKFDAKSGESYVVGAIEWNLFRDGTFLDACESGDPHTATARLCWPDLGWTGDLKRDKAIAEQPYYRHHTYRAMCKKLGHGSNYGGKPQTLSTQAKIPIRVVEQFQRAYFEAYPAHRRWQQHVEDTLLQTGHIISLSGRKRWFLGRRSENSTLREAIAYDPQCSLADIVNRGMLEVWRNRDAELYMHDHDALTVIYPEADEAKVIPKILKQLEQPIELKDGRTLLIPYDCKTGYNRGEASPDNPRGLTDYK